MKKVPVIWGVLVVVALAGIGGLYYYQNRTTKFQPNEAQTESTTPQQVAEQSPGTVRLLATGDMIAHDSINANAKKDDGSYDYISLMSGMRQYFDKGDVNFCNQATPAGGESFGISGYPVFNAPIAFARGIEEVGCNVINLGTNHTNDKGQELVDATVAAWDNRDVLAVAGANRSTDEQAKLRVFEVKGVTFAFVAYTDYTNVPLLNTYGVNRYSRALAASQISEAKKSADLVIASIRWGTEYSSEINSRQEQVAQELASAGADVIYGHGSHVLQPVKKLSADGGREVYVWYSLGNFLNSQLETEARIGGFASMQVNPDTKKITKAGFMPVYQHYEWTASEKAAENLLARRNFEMVPLDKAEELLAKSLLNTTVNAQMQRVTDVLNKYTEVEIMASDSF